MDNVFSLKRVRRTMASLSLAALVASFFAIGVAQAQTFPDVNPSDWFYSYTEDLVTLGVVNSSMPEYRPADNVNRAETTKLVVEAFDIPLESPATPTFDDVAPGTWYYEYVETAAAHGVVAGYKDQGGTLTGYFGPADDLTRGQAAKVFVLGAPLDENTLCGPTFPDVAVSDWFYPYVETLYVNSVVDGNPDGSYGPNNNINRAEIAKIVSNTMAPVVRPCGGFSVNSATPLSDTTLEVCYTQSYDDVSGLMSENYVVEDLDGNPLAVSMAEATSDPMCVLLTTDPQDSSKVYDLTVSGVTDADGMALVGDMGSFSGFSVGTPGDLEVRIDGSTPSSQDIPNNGANILYSVFAFQAGADEGARIEELVLTRQGLGLPGDFDAVKLYVDGVQVGSEKTINTSSNAATFAITGTPINIPAGSTVLVEARGDMVGAANSQNSLCIASPDDVLVYGESTDSLLPVGGSFAVCGNHMSTTSASVGQLTYETDDYSGAFNVGDTDQSILKIRLDVDNVEDTDVTRITVKNTGSADPQDYGNPTLYVSGSPLDATTSWVGDFLTFDLSEDPLFIERGNTKNVEMRVDIVGGLGSTANFDVYRDWHIEGTGRVYGYGVNVEEGTSPADPPVARLIEGGNLAFSLSSNNPTVGDVAPGAEDHEFMRFNMSTAGDGVTIRGFDIYVEYSSALDWNEVEDVKVWRQNSVDDWVVVAGPLDPPSGCCATPVILSFNDTFDQAPSTTAEYIVTADVINDAPEGAEYYMELDSSTVEAEYLSNGDPVAGADITGGTLSGQTQTVAPPSIDVEVSSSPGDQNSVNNRQDLDLVGFDLTASTADDLKVTTIELNCVDDGGGNTAACVDSFTNLFLFQKSGSTLTQLDGPQNATGGTVIFNNVNLTIPGGDTVKVLLRGDVTSSPTGGDDFSFELQLESDIAVEDSNGNSLVSDSMGPNTEKQLCETDPGALTEGCTLADAGAGDETPTVTFAANGTVEVSVEDSLNDDIILDGTSDVKVAEVTFSETGDLEDVKLRKLRIYNDVDAPGACLTGTAADTLKVTDGITTVTGVLTGNPGVATFSSLNFIIPQNGDLVLDVLVDTNNIGGSGATSGDCLNLAVLDLFTGAGDFDDGDTDVEFVGVSSGLQLDDASIVGGTAGYGGTDAYVLGNSDYFTLRNNIITITILNDYQGADLYGTAFTPAVAQKVLGFSIASEGDGTATIEEIVFDLAETCTGSYSAAGGAEIWTVEELINGGNPEATDDGGAYLYPTFSATGTNYDTTVDTFKNGAGLKVTQGTSVDYMLIIDTTVAGTNCVYAAGQYLSTRIDDPLDVNDFYWDDGELGGILDTGVKNTTKSATTTILFDT